MYGPKHIITRTRVVRDAVGPRVPAQIKQHLSHWPATPLARVDAYGNISNRVSS